MDYFKTILIYYDYMNFILFNASSKAAYWLLFNVASYSGHMYTVCEMSHAYSNLKAPLIFVISYS